MNRLKLFGIILGIGLVGTSLAVAAPPITEPIDTTVVNDAVNPVPITHFPVPYVATANDVNSNGQFRGDFEVPKGKS